MSNYNKKIQDIKTLYISRIYSRSSVFRFIEKYCVIPILFVVFWSLGIILLFTYGAAALDDDHHEKIWFLYQCFVFMPLFIIGFFWIVFLIFYLLKPKIINKKVFQIILFILYGISVIFFNLINFYNLYVVIVFKRYSLISAFISFLLGFSCPMIVFFIRFSIIRFKKENIDLGEYKNYLFEVVDPIFLTRIKNKKKHNSKFDYWQKNEIISNNLNIIFLGSKQGIYFFKYNWKEYAIFAYSLKNFALSKYEKNSINVAITNVILDFTNMSDEKQTNKISIFN